MNNYPFEITLKDNTKIQISDFKKEHKESIKRLLYKIPDEDILVFLDNEIDKDSIDWFVNPEFKKVVDLVAIHNKQIIANGTLHCEGIYWENTAELKIFVDPDYRSKGIGTQLFMLLIKEGLQKQFKKIIVRYKTNNFSFNKILEYYSIRPETIYNYIAENKMFNESKLMNIATINIEDWKKRFEFYNLFFKD